MSAKNNPPLKRANGERALNKRALSAGFAMAGVLLLLVVLAVLGVSLTRMFIAGQEDAARDAMGSQAYQAARAGLEAGLYQSLRSGVCADSAFTLPGLADYTISLSCARSVTSEGAQPIIIDTWKSLACNQAPCPSSAPRAGYVERELRASVGR